MDFELPASSLELVFFMLVRFLSLARLWAEADLEHSVISFVLPSFKLARAVAEALPALFLASAIDRLSLVLVLDNRALSSLLVDATTAAVSCFEVHCPMVKN